MNYELHVINNVNLKKKYYIQYNLYSDIKFMYFRLIKVKFKINNSSLN